MTASWIPLPQSRSWVAQAFMCLSVLRRLGRSSVKQVADELADVLTYLDLLAATLGVDLGRAAAQKFNEVSERVGFPDRIELAA